jgi:hypothetical protein
MENPQTDRPVIGTHPLLTMLCFSAVVATLIASGSYVSKQRSTARDLAAAVGEPIPLFSVNR